MAKKKQADKMRDLIANLSSQKPRKKKEATEETKETSSFLRKLVKRIRLKQ